MIDILHAAFAYLDEGYAVFPCNRQTKRPLVRWIKYQTKLPTKQDWQQWYTRWPQCNLGLVTGYYHNLAVLDFDSPEVYGAWLSGPTGHLAELTKVVTTQRGHHIYLTTAHDPGHTFIARFKKYHVEVRAKGSYVIAPPSIHAKGQRYHIVSDYHTPSVVDDIEIALGRFKRPKLVQPVGTKADLRNKPGVPTPTNGRLSKVQAIKQTFRIERWVKKAKDRPDSRGRIAAQCPLPGHDDKHMSFWYHPVDQVCACAVCTQGNGVNGSSGTWDVINLYAQINGLTIREAIEELYQLTPQGLREER